MVGKPLVLFLLALEFIAAKRSQPTKALKSRHHFKPIGLCIVVRCCSYYLDLTLKISLIWVNK